MNLLLIFLSAFAVNFAAAAAKTPSVNDDEAEVGSPCLGICTAIFIGLCAAGSAIAANPVAAGVASTVIVWGLQEGYKWYREHPGYQLLDEGKICPSGKNIKSFSECQETLAKISIQSTYGMVHNKNRDSDKAKKPKGCYVLPPKNWETQKNPAVIWNENGDASAGAMAKEHGNAVCIKSGAEAAVAEYERQFIEAQVAATAASSGEHDIMEKILFLFIGASLGYAATYCMRKDGARLLADYEAL